MEQLMAYELLDHTADIGIRVTETSIRDLFETAGLAMLHQITDLSTLTGTETKKIHVKGMDQADLLINWLRELLWCWTIDNVIVSKVHITEIDSRHLRAVILCDPYNPKIHEILKDIKAVTYHGVSVAQTAAGWTASVIFDV